MYHHPHRRARLARFLTALAFFAATTAGLHALADHYGWRQGHGPWQHGLGWSQGCDGSSASPTKPSL